MTARGNALLLRNCAAKLYWDAFENDIITRKADVSNSYDWVVLDSLIDSQIRTTAKYGEKSRIILVCPKEYEQMSKQG